MLTELFYDIDKFCKEFIPVWEKKLISHGIGKRCRTGTMSMSEIMTIVVYFHLAHYRNFKHYYLTEILLHNKDAFPIAVSYTRFVELMQRVAVPLMAYLKCCRMGEVSGISFIDSTILKVCHNRRIHRHKVFRNKATRGRSTMGWFYGFKLHIIVNDQGELISVYVSQGHVDDRNPDVIERLTKKLFGKLFGDRGYISQKLFDSLFARGIQLITRLKRNMKNRLMPLMDKILLRKRAIIETINDQLKNIAQIEHTRHRSTKNFIVNLLAGLIAYTFLPKKPSLNIRTSEKMLLAI